MSHHSGRRVFPRADRSQGCLARPGLRRPAHLAAANLLLLLAVLIPLVYACPADQTWIVGMYDAADGDDELGLLTDSGLADGGRTAVVDEIRTMAGRIRGASSETLPVLLPGVASLARGPPRNQALNSCPALRFLLPEIASLPERVPPPLITAPTWAASLSGGTRLDATAFAVWPDLFGIFSWDARRKSRATNGIELFWLQGK